MVTTIISIIYGIACFALGYLIAYEREHNG